MRGRGFVVLALALVLGCFSVAAPPAQADDASASAAVKKGLVSEGGQLSYYRDGDLVKERKLTVNGATYYFDAKGHAVRGTSVKIGKKYWIFGNDARLLTGKKRLAKLARGTFAVSAKGHPGKVGWQYKSGKLRYFAASGKMARSKTVQGITLKADGWNKSNYASKAKIAAIKRIKSITKPSWSKSRKLKACFDYTCKFAYAGSMEPKDIGMKGWVQRCGYRSLQTDKGDCFGYACAFALMAYELGYKPTVRGEWLVHAYVVINGRNWDYWHLSSLTGLRNWKVNSWSDTSPKGKVAKKAASKKSTTKARNGLVRQDGATYFYQNGKKLKSTWKTYKGKAYYFKGNGKAATKSYRVKRTRGAAKRYWVFNTKGVLQSGTKARTVTVAGVTYRVHKSGSAWPGWNSAKTKRYLGNGARATEVQLIGDKLFAFSAKGTYRASTTTALRAAAKSGKPAAKFISLMGKAKRTSTAKASCYRVPGQPDLDGVDRTRTYAHITLCTFVGEDGVEYFESVLPR